MLLIITKSPAWPQTDCVSYLKDNCWANDEDSSRCAGYSQAREILLQLPGSHLEFGTPYYQRTNSSLRHGTLRGAEAYCLPLSDGANRLLAKRRRTCLSPTPPSEILLSSAFSEMSPNCHAWHKAIPTGHGPSTKLQRSFSCHVKHLFIFAFTPDFFAFSASSLRSRSCCFCTSCLDTTIPWDGHVLPPLAPFCTYNNNSPGYCASTGSRRSPKRSVCIKGSDKRASSTPCAVVEYSHECR